MRVLILLLMLLTLQALAEDVALPEPIPEKQNKVEEIFEKFEEAFRIQAVLEVPEYSLYLGGPAIQGVAYVPSFGPRLGPRIFYKGVGLKFTFPLPMAEVVWNVAFPKKSVRHWAGISGRAARRSSRPGMSRSPPTLR